MKIELVIQELLYKESQISIPGFGILEAQYCPARIIKSEQLRFIPPHKNISFKSDANATDVSLIKNVSEQFSLTKDQAKTEVEKFVKNALELLEKYSQFQLEGLGIFYYDKDGKIQFKSDDSVNYLTETFGLSDFNVKTFPKESAAKQAVKKKVEEKDSVRKKIAKSIFIAIPIVFALMLIPNVLHFSQSAKLLNLFGNTEVYVDLTEPNKPLPEQSSTYFSTPQPSNAAYDTPLGGSKKTEEIAVKKTEKQEAVVETAIEKEVVSKEIATKENYYIIVGSFGSKGKAQKFADKLNAKSHNAGVITRGSKIRVFASKHSTRKEAIESLADLRLEPSFKSSWLFVDI